jgi:hypothetical protein
MGAKPGRGVDTCKWKEPFKSGFTDIFEELPKNFDYCIWILLLWSLDVCLLLSDVCCPVEVYETGWSLVQGSPTECGVSECDREASIMRRAWHTGGC